MITTEKGKIYSIVDIGANSIRLSLYQLEKDNDIKPILKNKVIAGLASYKENGVLTKAGIEVAANVLNDFNATVKNLGLEKLHAFATASLRNIKNRDEAKLEIESRTGLEIDLVSGREEAKLAYIGVMQLLKPNQGLIVDVGGGSTEIVAFEKNKIKRAESLPVGSLGLFNHSVSDLLPTKKESKKIIKKIQGELSGLKAFEVKKNSTIYGVGGSIRATNKIVSDYLQSEVKEMRPEQIKDAYKAITLKKILRIAPERVHTLLPGMLLIQEVAKYFNAKKIIVSNYGVREGYMLHKVMEKGILHERYKLHSE